jgi:hypothetical protein
MSGREAYCADRGSSGLGFDEAEVSNEEDLLFLRYSLLYALQLAVTPSGPPFVRSSCTFFCFAGRAFFGSVGCRVEPVETRAGRGISSTFELLSK